MGKKYAIGIDFGTLSGRAVVTDVADGRTLSDCSADYAHGVISEKLPGCDQRLPGDYALQHPADYIDVIKRIVPRAVKEANADPKDVISIGIDFTCCTVMPVYADGTPLAYDEKYKNNPHAYVKIWKHHGAQKYADMINEKIRETDKSLADHYGGTISSEWTIPKAWDLLDNAPEIYEDAKFFIEAGDWIVWMLTGVLRRAYGFASYDCMYVKERGGYPPDGFLALLDERLGGFIKDKMAGEIVYPGQKVGCLNGEYASAFGLSSDVVVSCPMPDAHAATFSLGLKEDGDMCAIMGTSSCYLLINGEFRGLDGVCGGILDGMVPGFYAYASGLCCVGDQFAWAEKNVVTDEYLKEAAERKIPVIRLLVEKASRQKPGQNGLLALDWFNGNRNILADSRLSGMILGLTLRTKPEDILRALIEATAFGTKAVLDNFEQNGLKIRRITAAGGIARKDPFTMQVYSDVLDRKIGVSRLKQASAAGSAIQSTVAAGAYATIKEAMAHMQSDCDIVYEPVRENVLTYGKLFGEYMRLHDYFGRGENNVMKMLKDLADERS